MVSDELEQLYVEKKKRIEILNTKPDTTWAKQDISKINKRIKELEAKELPKIHDEKVKEAHQKAEQMQSDADKQAAKAKKLAN